MQTTLNAVQVTMTDRERVRLVSRYMKHELDGLSGVAPYANLWSVDKAADARANDGLSVLSDGSWVVVFGRGGYFVVGSVKDSAISLLTEYAIDGKRCFEAYGRELKAGRTQALPVDWLATWQRLDVGQESSTFGVWLARPWVLGMAMGVPCLIGVVVGDRVEVVA